jgi:hypothetical protein
MSKSKTTNAFILMWDIYGLEAVHAISRYESWEKEELISILKTNKVKKNPLNSMMHMWELRARMNGHRHYEIWAIDCEDTSIDEDWWLEQFKEQPQEMVDLIREKGACFWNGRGSDRVQRII